MKYKGKLGFVKTEEDVNFPGKYVQVATERTYMGDVINTPVAKWSSSSESSNDTITIRHTLSIVLDSFVLENLEYLKYAFVLGKKWKIESIKVERPRMILELGGIYNG